MTGSSGCSLVLDTILAIVALPRDRISGMPQVGFTLLVHCGWAMPENLGFVVLLLGWVQSLEQVQVGRPLLSYVSLLFIFMVISRNDLPTPLDFYVNLSMDVMPLIDTDDVHSGDLTSL